MPFAPPVTITIGRSVVTSAEPPPAVTRCDCLSGLLLLPTCTPAGAGVNDHERDHDERPSHSCRPSALTDFDDAPVELLLGYLHLEQVGIIHARVAFVKEALDFVVRLLDDVSGLDGQTVELLHQDQELVVGCLLP